jgi:TrmH family RNA methyltransferase
MKRISSRQNPLFKRFREAIREHADEIVLEGPKPVADALASGWEPIEVVRRGEEFSDELFDALTETRSPQNVLGLFQRPRFAAKDVLSRSAASIIVALDAVQDPGNVGTMVRLAAAFDAAGVLLLPGCADAFGPKAIRASVGAILTVPVAPITSADLLSCGVPLVATAMSGAPVDPPVREAILVFGNEGTGVSAEVLAASRTIAIPMSGRVESLNVAASAAILLARSYTLRVAEVRT